MMRTIYRKDGLMITGWVTVGEINYPDPKSAFDAGAQGITQAEVDDYPDLNLFDVAEDLAGNLTITPKSPAVIAARVQLETNQKSLAYLLSTDWYAIRFAEEGTPIPDDVKAKRQESRAAIVRVEAP